MVGSKDILIEIIGDNKKFKNSIDNSDKSMDSFVSKVRRAGPAMAAGLAVGIAAFSSMAIKMAAAEEVVTNQTESLLKQQGIMWSSVSEEANNYFNQIEKLTAYGDTDVQLAFNKMIASGMSYNQAMKSMTAVTSIAYSHNMDLVSSAQLLSDAYNGKTARLEKLGVEYNKNTDSVTAYNEALDTVESTMADASERTDTLAGKQESIKNTADDTAEAFGARLIPEMHNLVDGMADASGGAEELGDLLGRLAVLPLTLGRQSGEHIKIMQRVNDLRKAGVDTEQEFINAFSLQSKNLVEMSDEQFNYATQVLTAAGYHERVLKLEMARAYGQSQKLRTLEEEKKVEEQLLALDKERTAEGEKQLTIEERKLAYLSKYGQSEAMRATKAGIDVGQLSGTRLKYKAGQQYTRESGAITITGPGQKSGV